MYELTTIPFHATHGDEMTPLVDPFRDLFESADVVIAIDVMTDSNKIIFGANHLESGHGGCMVHVSLDFDSTELDRLEAFVGLIKNDVEHDEA